MANHRRASTRQPARLSVAEPAESYWSVDAGAWSSVRPGLPAHLVDLLAPPIVVGVARAPGQPGRFGGGGPRSGPR